MTYRDDSTLSTTLLEQLTTNGLDALPDLFRVLLNAAMQIERQNHLGAALHERTEQRTGHANGYKDKILATRLGQITVAVPQVREGGFYPQRLERGTRSERALKLALAEMYVQGVSTRKVAAITEQLCGFAVSSGQVSQAASVRRPQSGGLSQAASVRRPRNSMPPWRLGAAAHWPSVHTYCWTLATRKYARQALFRMPPC